MARSDWPGQSVLPVEHLALQALPLPPGHRLQRRPVHPHHTLRSPQPQITRVVFDHRDQLRGRQPLFRAEGNALALPNADQTGAFNADPDAAVASAGQ